MPTSSSRWRAGSRTLAHSVRLNEFFDFPRSGHIRTAPAGLPQIEAKIVAPLRVVVHKE
jgi:hypothetical protein